MSFGDRYARSYYTFLLCDLLISEISLAWCDQQVSLVQLSNGFFFSSYQLVALHTPYLWRMNRRTVTVTLRSILKISEDLVNEHDARQTDWEKGQTCKAAKIFPENTSRPLPDSSRLGQRFNSRNSPTKIPSSIQQNLHLPTAGWWT